VLGIWLISTDGITEEKSDLLILKPVSDDFQTNIPVGTDPKLSGVDDGIIAVGLLDIPYFSVQDISHVALNDVCGNPVPLWVETTSLYSEFDDGTINMMRIAFLIPESDLEKGALRLSWGDSVKSENRMVDRIDLYQENRDRYRTFICEAQPRGNDAGNFSSSVVVIVDDKADIYFLWYLLPIILIFIFLFVRKALNR
jgi:hypothetical protein